MEYDHTNQPLSQLVDRQLELYDLTHIPHSPERTAQIQREMSCIAVEIYFRRQEGETL